MYSSRIRLNPNPQFTGYNPTDPDYNPTLRNRPPKAGQQRPENNWSTAPERPEGRRAYDHRSAEKIIYDNPAVSELLQKRSFVFIEDDLKRLLGDWTAANPDFDTRADAAYDLARLVNALDHVDTRRVGTSDPGNGIIDGFDDHGPLTHERSEARWLDEISKHGYPRWR